MRTAIHPNQIPKERPPHNEQNSERKELFFPELPIEILIHYLEQSASDNYFNSNKPETKLPKSKIIPTMYGPPVKETIFIMGIMYLNQLKKEEKNTPQSSTLEDLLKRSNKNTTTKQRLTTNQLFAGTLFLFIPKI